MEQKYKNRNKRQIGAEHEKLAGDYLKSQGYEILEYNFFSRYGEIDIVARHGEYLVFAEVKFRKTLAAGHPFEAITVQKQRARCKSAAYYMKKHGLEYMPVRFDVVGIAGEEIQVLQNAFEYLV